MRFDDFVELKFSNYNDDDYMEMALSQAKRARSKGDVACGAVIACGNKHFSARDTVATEMNPLAEATVNAISKVLETTSAPSRIANSVLYSTVEPSSFSALAAHAAGIREILFGVYNHKNGFVTSNKYKLEGFDIKSKGGILAKECFDILSKDMKEYCSIDGKL